MRILDLITEDRKIDPVKLAVRVANKFGKRDRYGNWESPIKRQHIPLKSFKSKKADKVYDVYTKVRMSDPDHFSDKFTRKQFSIKDLIAIQPFVRINDLEQLKAKINDKDPEYIRIATYKNENYIMDGHHAVVAAWLRGDETITANSIDLDYRGLL